MANPHRGQLAFEAGGENYVLHYTFNSLAELETLLKMNFTEIFKVLQSGELSINMMRSLFWAGLIEHRPELDLRAAGSIMSSVPGGPSRISELIGEAMSAAFGSETKTPAAEAPPGNGAARPPMGLTPPGTGGSSSSTSSVTGSMRPGSGGLPREN